MKFSIILTTFNSEKWIQQCINSILLQSYKDFNLLILDSGSTDGTLNWINNIQDNRIKIYTTDKRLSIEENWAKIIDVPKNEFMTIIGHDDILYPDFLEEINKLILLYPGASLYHTHFNFINASGKISRHCKPMKEKYSGYDFLVSFMSNSIDSMGTGYVMRSKDYNELHGIPTKYPNLLFADFELWQKLINKSYMMVSPENLFAFRIHKSVTSVSQDYKLHIALKIFVDFLADLKLRDSQFSKIIDEYGTQFLLFYCKGFAHRLLRTPYDKRNGLSVAVFIEQTKKLAQKIGVEKKYHPENLLSIRIPKFIDNNLLFRNLFLAFKKIYSKPIYK